MADILRFPIANQKADRAYWIGEAEREAAQLAGATEIADVKVLDQGRPSDSAPFEADDEGA